MPIFNLICPRDGTRRRVLRPQGWKSTDEVVTCAFCADAGLEDSRMVRDTGEAKMSTLVKETIDNGAMVKRLERFADAERLHKDRVEIEDALAKGKDPGRPIR